MLAVVRLRSVVACACAGQGQCDEECDEDQWTNLAPIVIHDRGALRVMRSRMWCLCVVLAYVTGCKGGSEPLPTSAEKTALADTACPRVTNPYFFEVTKDGRTSHFLGTRHMGVGLDKFPARVRTTLDEASLLVEEVPPGEHDKPIVTPEPLRDELGPKDWAHLVELAGETAAKRMETTQSVVAALVLVLMYEDLTVTLDRQIEDRAKAKAIPGAGLETARFQRDLIARLIDVRLLKAIVEEMPERARFRTLTREGLERYCSGTEKDVAVVDGFKEEQMLAHGYTRAELDRFQDELVYKRNADWIPKLEKLLEQDKVFVAIGAGHLRGPGNVLELLSARGYTITRVTN